MRIVLTGGGTGGHTYPLVAVYQALNKLAVSYGQQVPDVSYVGPDDFASSVIEKEGIDAYYISAGKMRRYFSLLNILDPFKIIVGIVQSLWWLWYIMPDVVFSKGGFGSVPVVLAAWIYRIPIVIHESDSIPGKANVFASRLATSIAVSFEKAVKYFPAKKTALTGNPIESDFFNVADKKTSLESFSIYSQKPVIGFLGGSQGAVQINEIVLDLIDRLVTSYEVIHITGKANFAYMQSETEKILKENQRYFYHIVSSLDISQMMFFYEACDIIISRAGAGTIFELAATGKPSILIPLESSAGGHQRENAFIYSKAGACVVLETSNLTPNLLLENIQTLLNNKNLTDVMSSNARNFAKVDSADLIAKQIFYLAEKN